MKKVILAVCCALLACDKPAEEYHTLPKPPPMVVAPSPEPTNPFEKSGLVPTPALNIPPFQQPHFIQIGGELKLNDSWSFWTWRDDANQITCYFYTVMSDGHLVQSGMSCVR